MSARKSASGQEDRRLFLKPSALSLATPCYPNTKSSKSLIARRLTFSVLYLAVCSAAFGQEPPPRIQVGRLRVELERLVNRPNGSLLGNVPLHVDTANDGSGRFFFAEQDGRVQVRLPNGNFSTFLDLTGEAKRVNGPDGLLGIDAAAKSAELVLHEAEMALNSGDANQTRSPERGVIRPLGISWPAKAKVA